MGSGPDCISGKSKRARGICGDVVKPLHSKRGQGLAGFTVFRRHNELEPGKHFLRLEKCLNVILDLASVRVGVQEVRSYMKSCITDEGKERFQVARLVILLIGSALRNVP